LEALGSSTVEIMTKTKADSAVEDLNSSSSKYLDLSGISTATPNPYDALIEASGDNTVNQPPFRNDTSQAVPGNYSVSI
jgi:hypothetical protein